MKGKGLIVLLALLAAGYYGYRYLPAHYNPLAPLRLEYPPGFITHYKLRRLTPGQCARLLKEANQRNLITSRAVTDSGGECPLQNVVRVRDFGAVKLSSSFLASCPLALSSAVSATAGETADSADAWARAPPGRPFWQLCLP